MVLSQAVGEENHFADVELAEADDKAAPAAKWTPSPFDVVVYSEAGGEHSDKEDEA